MLRDQMSNTAARLAEWEEKKRHESEVQEQTHQLYFKLNDE